MVIDLVASPGKIRVASSLQFRPFLGCFRQFLGNAVLEVDQTLRQGEVSPRAHFRPGGIPGKNQGCQQFTILAVLGNFSEAQCWKLTKLLGNLKGPSRHILIPSRPQRKIRVASNL